MIVTLTPNPSLDRTLHVSRLTRGRLLRADAVAVVASGKGVNVSRNVAANGVPTIVVLPVGGHDGHRLADELAAERLQVRAVAIGGAVRSNITLLEPDGTATKVNEPGPVLTPAEQEALRHSAIESAAGADWLVGSGSLPPGTPPDFYARLVQAARAAGDRTQVAVDCTGAALLAAVAAGADVVKPNAVELAEATGRRLHTRQDVVTAARMLLDRGTGAVLASLGTDGALLVTPAATWHASGPPIRLHSTIGAGDALLAGFLAGGGTARPKAALALGVAYATRRCALPASEQPRVQPSDMAAVAATMLADGVDVALSEPALPA